MQIKTRVVRWVAWAQGHPRGPLGAPGTRPPTEAQDRGRAVLGRANRKGGEGEAHVPFFLLVGPGVVGRGGEAGRWIRVWGILSLQRHPQSSSKYTPEPGAIGPYPWLGHALGPGAPSSAWGSDECAAAPPPQAAVHAHQPPTLQLLVLLLLLFLLARGAGGLSRPPGPSHGAGR